LTLWLSVCAFSAFFEPISGHFFLIPCCSPLICLPSRRRRASANCQGVPPLSRRRETVHFPRLLVSSDPCPPVPASFRGFAPWSESIRSERFRSATFRSFRPVTTFPPSSVYSSDPFSPLWRLSPPKLLSPLFLAAVVFPAESFCTGDFGPLALSVSPILDF